ASRRNRQADPAAPFDRNAVVNLTPRIAAVCRFEDPTAGTVRCRVDAPRRPARVPQRRENRARIRRIDVQIDGADVVALEQHLLPRRAAVARTVDAAVGVAAVRMAERGDVYEV